MDENVENKDGLRVTRARTRRQSVLDTDSRPATPQHELASDRGTASPRPLRRTRLNSTTIDLRTPTRATRSSVARGETPEPITPSASVASLRSARTPAKSARKQLPVQEEDEEPVQVKVETKSSPLELDSGGKHTPVPTGEKRVTRSMSKSPPIAVVKTQMSRKTPKEDSHKEKEEQLSNTESNVSPAIINLQSKTIEIEAEKTRNQATSKIVVKVKEISQTFLSNNIIINNVLPKSEEGNVVPMEVDEIDLCEDDINTSSAKSENLPLQKLDESGKTSTLEKSLMESRSDKLETKSVTEIVEIPTEQKAELIKTNSAQEISENVLEASIKTNSPNKMNNSSIHEILDTENEEKTSKKIMETPNITMETSKNIAHEEEKTLDAVVIESDSSFKSVEVSPKTEGKAAIGKETETNANNSFESMETASPKDQKEEVIMELEESNNNDVLDDGASTISVDVISNIRLPDLSPDVKQRIVSTSDHNDELKKSVVFNSDDQESSKSYNKRKFPKTPSRDKPPLSSATIKSFMEKERDTPLKVKVRHSSTPIQKMEEISLTKSIANSSSSQPPAQIDSIKPLVMPVDVEIKPSSPKVVPRRLVSDNEDEDQEDYSEDEENICLFVDNEVEVADENYQSGDSMNSSERREIEENEVPCDGESVGSQDTIDSFGDDESGENDSFIVSDNDVEEDNVEEEDEADDDIEPLCWNNDQEDDAANTSKDSKKQRRRIIVVDSSDENEVGDEPELIELEQSNRSNTSNASKLSEAAMILNASIDDGNEDEMADDPELESSRKMILHDISKPDCFNKTVSRLEISTIDVNTTVEESSDPEPDAEPKSSEIKPSTSSAKGADDEEALLAELASGDLTHLQKMFNPLQKSRRQSLYLPSPEPMVNKEPKLKRRSERMLNDFNPSQSFMEMVAEQQRQKPKRQRLSKSFCGAADDEILEQAQPVQIVVEAIKKTGSKLANDELNKEEEIPTTSSPQEEAPPKEKTKSIDHYMKYCDEILQAANQAKLEQKKQEIAARGDDARKRKKSLRKAEPPVVAISVSPESELNSTEFGAVKKTKKKIKRLVPDKKQAIQHAVNRAIELLVPDMIQRAPQSLARKLSPQPPVDKPKAKNKAKADKPLEKQKKQLQQQQLVSPMKSSDEENHHNQRPIERFRTNAGYVTVYKDDSPERSVIELIKTKSGIMRVEPTSPSLKYFEELPPTPKIQKPCFREEPVDQKKKIKHKGNQAAGRSGSSTESALQFKARVLARKL